ncbi:MAG: alpha/beta hydrolase [Planctomycetota bacterium]|nr:alpha/beta hydrolase [Planctomycetota bacterium]
MDSSKLAVPQRMAILFPCLILTMLPLLSCEGDGKKKPKGTADKVGLKKPKVYKVKTHKNLAYVADKKKVGRRKLDLYLPKSTEGFPLFMYIHGGAWISGDKSQYSKIGKSFASQGIAFAIINYRLSTRSNGVQHPDPVLDGAAAVHWLKKNAKTYGYMDDCIVVGGHSAGAHMTGLLTLDPTYLGKFEEKTSVIAGAIGLEGIYDIPGLIKRWPDYRGDFIALAFGSELGWSAASPQSYCNGKEKAPWLVIHSPKDELVDMPQSENFVKALTTKGVTTTFFNKLDSSHFGTVQDLGSKKGRETEAQIVKFIKGLVEARKKS